jgi:rhodanese-related sulfurtransferase
MPATERLMSGALDVFSPEETKDLMDKGEAVLVDVRTPAEYAFEHIRGALLAPLSDFEPRLLPTQERKRLIFHCASGNRSKVVAEKMLEAGLGPVAHMEGGLAGWKRARLPFVGTDPMSGGPRNVVSG